MQEDHQIRSFLVSLISFSSLSKALTSEMKIYEIMVLNTVLALIMICLAQSQRDLGVRSKVIKWVEVGKAFSLYFLLSFHMI